MKLTTFRNNVPTEKNRFLTLNRETNINKKFFSIFILFVGVIFSACVSDSSSKNSSEESASLSFSAEWVSTNDSFESLDLTNCETISSVSARIFTANSPDQLLKTGGPWSCSTGQGEMDSVPSGYSAYVTVYGRDASNQILYIGDSEAFNLISNETAHAGVVVAQSFTPTLISPADNEMVSSEGVIFEWSDPSSHAVAYHLQIATSLEFSEEDIVLDVPTINENRYRPNISDFSTDRPYYWRIFSLEKLGDTSASSIVRSFMIGNGPASIEALFSWDTSMDTPNVFEPKVWNQSGINVYEHDGPLIEFADGQAQIPSLPGNEPLKVILYGINPFSDAPGYAMRGESEMLAPQATIDFGVIDMKNFIPTPIAPLDNTSYDQSQTSITFEWEKVSSAVAYEIVFLTLDEGLTYIEDSFIQPINIPASNSGLTQAYSLIVEPQYSGTMYWSVKAIDAEGAKSVWGTVFNYYLEPVYLPE